jgi:hypothetical protein
VAVRPDLADARRAAHARILQRPRRRGTIQAMRRLRLLLFFVLYATAELTVPHALTPVEAIEGAEEGVRHGRRGRSALKAARARTEVGRQPVAVAAAPRRVPGAPIRPLPPPAIRKIPPSFAESPSAPEDH